MYVVAMSTIQHLESLHKVVVSITSVMVHEELPGMVINFIDVVKQVEVILDRIDREMRLIGMSETKKEVLATVDLVEQGVPTGGVNARE